MRFSSFVVALLLFTGALALATSPVVFAHGWAGGMDTMVFAVAASTTLLGSAILAWRDTYAFALLAAFLGGAALVGALLAIWVGGPVTSGLVVFAATGTVALALGAGYAAWNQFARASVPDVLREHFDRAFIFETGGVQLASTVPGFVPIDTIVPFELYLQNCMDVPREVSVAFDDVPLFGRGGNVRWRTPSSVSLEPAEVKLVTIPFCAARVDAGSQTVYLQVRAKGPTGKRLRPRRAPHAAGPLARWQIALIVVLAFPLVTLIVWGRGGLSLKVRFTPAGRLRHEDELPAPSAERIWAHNPTRGR